jgi:hypothetical protein
MGIVSAVCFVGEYIGFIGKGTRKGDLVHDRRIALAGARKVEYAGTQFPDKGGYLRAKIVHDHSASPYGRRLQPIEQLLLS